MAWEGVCRSHLISALTFKYPPLGVPDVTTRETTYWVKVYFAPSSPANQTPQDESPEAVRSQLPLGSEVS